jgi:NAD(P)-dependent dehydrogenase (short-subunit alcohol dehydrogenase family)
LSLSPTILTFIQSKLANILFAKELARRLSGERIWSNALHPGNINTELSRGPKEKYPYLKPLISLVGCMLATTYRGATTPLFAATAAEVEENDWRCVFVCLWFCGGHVLMVELV